MPHILGKRHRTIYLLQKPLKYVFSIPNENFNHRADFLIPLWHNWDEKKDHIFVHVLPRDIAIVYKRMLWFIKAELHIHASVNLASIGSDNGLAPDRCQAIIWTNAGSLWIGPLRTTFKSRYNNFLIKRLIWKCRLQNEGHFVSASVC